jgi:hypothetical protein
MVVFPAPDLPANTNACLRQNQRVQDAYDRVNRIGTAMLPDHPLARFQVPLCAEITALDVPGSGTEENLKIGIGTAFSAGKKVDREFGGFLAARAKEVRIASAHQAGEGAILAPQVYGNAADYDGYANQLRTSPES